MGHKYNNNMKAVVQIDKTTGSYVNTFSSIAEAARQLEYPNYKKIHDVIKGRGRIRSYRGYVFVYEADYDNRKDYRVVRAKTYKK